MRYNVIQTAEIYNLVAEDIKQVEAKMRRIVGDHNPTLVEAIEYCPLPR